MKRFIILLLIGLVAYSSRSLWLDSAKSLVPPSFIDSFQSIDFSNFSWEAIDDRLSLFCQLMTMLSRMNQSGLNSQI